MDLSAYASSPIFSSSHLERRPSKAYSQKADGQGRSLAIYGGLCPVRLKGGTAQKGKSFKFQVKTRTDV